MKTVWAALLATGAIAISFYPRDARACGCFAPPDPSRPVVQAGERIVFAVEDGVVTAHIQIQYSGSAEEFAWLVPLPAIPEVTVGVEELFTQIDATTTPSFLLNSSGFCGGGGISVGCADESLAAADIGVPRDDPNKNVAVVVSEAGPYEYAVLDASAKDPMLQWLEQNRYFVPGGTGDALTPYIQPGAYFLALRLRTGQSAGDIQPIVLQYESQYPMIPIVLTSVGAIPDMGVLVWVLGDSRAVPRNYQHVVINDAHIDWVDGASNYGEVVKRAIDEADGHHAWVTEYAGSSRPMQNILNPPGRFGSKSQYTDLTDIDQLIQLLRNNSFSWPSLTPIFRKYLPVPERATREGIEEQAYYDAIEQYLNTYGRPAMIDLHAMIDEIFERVVEPTLRAGALFDRHPYMSRLYTILSPEEMTEDPVFSFNPDLPDVSNQHTATLENTCEDDLPFAMHLEDGRTFLLKDRSEWSRRADVDINATPSSMRIEVLREEGQPTVVVDNQSALTEAAENEMDGGGCSAAGRRRGVVLVNFAFIALVIGVGRRAMMRSRKRDA